MATRAKIKVDTDIQVTIRFGALATSIHEQLDSQKLMAPISEIKQWQRSANAILQLYLNRLIPESVKNSAQRKLFKEIAKTVKLKRKRQP